jgi:hypothetical protein
MEFDEEIPPEMDITPTPRLLAVLESLDIDPWRCVAEFIDNGLDDFVKAANPNGIVKVWYEDRCLFVSDNGSGMTFSQLQDALKAGYSDKSKADELGLFGIGFNVATARLGRRVELFTRNKNESRWLYVDLNINNLIKAKKFGVQPRYAYLDDPIFESGTNIKIHLSKEQIQKFERPAFQKEIARQLGRIYSFILRSEIPGVTGACAGNPRKVQIEVGNHKVSPYIPCIWSENRSVTYQKEDISAVQKFDRKLPDVSLCQDCGHWHDVDTKTTCDKCGFGDLVVASRRVWGWIGVQRFMDKIDFGVDFIRNGRSILTSDQSIFTFTDSTTGETYKDYPVEWPADMGRIVGEVHCDHVAVEFVKSRFIKADPNFRGALEIVRGNTSLQPKRAKSENNSPLAKIFNAFRINTPGERYLIPGNGERAIHVATKNWAEKFRDGISEFQADDKWFDAAVAHDKNVPGNKPGKPEEKDLKPGRKPDGGAPFSPVSPTTPDAPAPKSKPAQIPETINQKIEKWKAGGTKRFDLSKMVNLGSELGSYDLDVWETFVPIVGPDGSKTAVQVVPIRGINLFIVVDPGCDQVRKYGRSTTDLILFELAFEVKAKVSSKFNVSDIYNLLLGVFPDEELSEKVLKARMAELLTRISGKLVDCVMANPKPVIKALSRSEIDVAETNCVGSSQEIWSDALNSGNFARYLSYEGIHEIVSKLPDTVFDGKLFKQHYATAHAPAARARTQGYVSRALQDLAIMYSSASTLNEFEIKIADISLQFLTNSLRDD